MHPLPIAWPAAHQLTHVCRPPTPCAMMTHSQRRRLPPSSPFAAPLSPPLLLHFGTPIFSSAARRLPTAVAPTGRNEQQQSPPAAAASAADFRPGGPLAQLVGAGLRAALPLSAERTVHTERAAHTELHARAWRDAWRRRRSPVGSLCTVVPVALAVCVCSNDFQTAATSAPAVVSSPPLSYRPASTTSRAATPSRCPCAATLCWSAFCCCSTCSCGWCATRRCRVSFSTPSSSTSSPISWSCEGSHSHWPYSSKAQQASQRKRRQHKRTARRIRCSSRTSSSRRPWPPARS